MYQLSGFPLFEKDSIRSSGISISSINYLFGQVRLDTPFPDTVRITYKFLPLGIKKNYYYKYTTSQRNQAQPRRYSYTQKKGKKIEISGEKDFSIGLGEDNKDITQSLFLQIDGPLTDEINVSGVLSDKSLKVDRYGSSKKLENIEEIYIRAYTENAHATVGDYRINSSHLPGQKLVRGFSAGYSTLRAEYGISKSNFEQEEIILINGKYGKYYFSGGSSQYLSTIISESESIYLENRKLNRDSDYKIDYHEQYIMLSDKLAFQSGDRLIIEYEVEDGSYRHSIAGMSGASWRKSSPFQFDLDVFYYNDDKNSPVSFSISDSIKSIMENTGDSLFLIPAQKKVTEDTYTPFLMPYRLEDGIFIADSTSDYVDADLYYIDFSPAVDGDYEYNGSYHYYIGDNQGSYTPYRLAEPPAQYTTINSSNSWQLTDNLTILGDVSVSNYDKNTFSSLDDDDNTGYKSLGGITYNSSTGVLDTLRTSFAFEKADKNYSIFQDNKFSRDKDESYKSLPENDYTKLKNVNSFKIGRVSCNNSYSFFDRGDIHDFAFNSLFSSNDLTIGSNMKLYRDTVNSNEEIELNFKSKLASWDFDYSGKIQNQSNTASKSTRLLTTYHISSSMKIFNNIKYNGKVSEHFLEDEIGFGIESEKHSINAKWGIESKNQKKYYSANLGTIYRSSILSNAFSYKAAPLSFRIAERRLVFVGYDEGNYDKYGNYYINGGYDYIEGHYPNEYDGCERKLANQFELKLNRQFFFDSDIRVSTNSEEPIDKIAEVYYLLPQNTLERLINIDNSIKCKLSKSIISSYFSLDYNYSEENIQDFEVFHKYSAKYHHNIGQYYFLNFAYLGDSNNSLRNFHSSEFEISGEMRQKWNLKAGAGYGEADADNLELRYYNLFCNSSLKTEDMDFRTNLTYKKNKTDSDVNNMNYKNGAYLSLSGSMTYKIGEDFYLSGRGFINYNPILEYTKHITLSLKAVFD